MADVYAMVTARIIEQLEKGNIPWRNDSAYYTPSTDTITLRISCFA